MGFFSLRNWLLYSTLLSVFCSRFLINVGGLSLFYFYFIVLINLCLLAANGYLWSPQRLNLFIGYLFASGILGLLLGTNSVPGFIKSFLGISLCALYSTMLMRYLGFQAVDLFRRFAALAFYAAIYGIISLPWSPGRLVSVFLEPSSFAIVCIPALYYYVDQWQRTRRYGIRAIVLLVAVILTLSSLGYMGMALGALFFGMRYRFGRLVVPWLVVGALVLTFQNSSFFQSRVADTVSGAGGKSDVGTLNGSSMGVVINLIITEHQFAEHPILGGGLGSHIIAHDRFLGEIPGAFYLMGVYQTLGQWDASSLMLRIISELGLVGVFGAFWFLWHYFPRGATPEERAIALALLCYVFMKFLRSGEYFGAEQFFFFSIYTTIGVLARARTARAHRQKLQRIKAAQANLALSGVSRPTESMG